MLEHAHKSNNMSSSDDDGLSSAYVDSAVIHRQDLFHSSDFERSPKSAHIDDNSEDIMSEGSSGGCGLESAELLSASDKEPCSSGSASINQSTCRVTSGWNQG